jgi:hypothetical protein
MTRLMKDGSRAPTTSELARLEIQLAAHWEGGIQEIEKFLAEVGPHTPRSDFFRYEAGSRAQAEADKGERRYNY